MARSKRTTRVVNYTESPVSSPAPSSASAATTTNNNHGKKKKKQQTLQQWTGGAKSSKSTETTENNNDVTVGGQLKKHSNGKLCTHIIIIGHYFYYMYSMFSCCHLMTCHYIVTASLYHLTPSWLPSLLHCFINIYSFTIYMLQQHHSLSIHQLAPMQHHPLLLLLLRRIITTVVVVIIRQWNMSKLLHHRDTMLKRLL